MKRFLLTVLSLFFVSASFFAGKVYAVDPIPGARIPCPDIKNPSSDPNFISSRPYQASPCGDSPKAIMCGNSLQIIEKTPSQRAPFGTPSLQVDFPMGNKTYAAKLSGATFPIVGNTELTANSQNATDQIDDATKVNEYLSWYLNGVTNRAEYGSAKNTSYEAVNLSGPVQKLLPGAIQDADRIASIDNLYKIDTYSPEAPQNPGQHPGPGTLTKEASTHDQIVVCAKKQPALGIIGGIFGLVNRAVPHECYQGGGQPSVKETYRLSDWNGNLGIVRTFSNTAHSIVGGILNTIINAANAVASVLNTIPGVENAANTAAGTLQNAIGATPVVGVVVNKVVIPAAAQVISNATSTAWNNRKPPLPWGINPNTGKVFTSVEYQRAYNEWRGQSCLIVPIINRLVCFDDPVAASPEWSDLFPYVPLSNTVDKSAHLPITGVGINGLSGTEVELPAIAYNIIQEPILYYPHTAEVSELSNSLNQTYIPKEGTSNSAPSSSVEPVNDPTTGNCRILDLRSNPGDYLFPEVDPSEVNVFVNEYRVTQVPCHDVISNYLGTQYALCQGEVAIEIRMKTKVPYADEIYNSTTAGADSTFRRIYPKVEAGAPVSCISNIPSVSDVKYTSTENLNGMKVIGPLGDNTTDNAKLYFPHLGSVYDYFLKGIQTALRPQGYGEPTPVSGKYCTPTVPTDCSAANVPDSAVPSNLLGSFKARFVDLANRWTVDCPGPNYNLADKCYNYVVSEAKKAGVNPAFALTIWLNESGASNYCHGGPTTQDLGINLSSLYQNIVGQLKVFLDMAKQPQCSGVAGFREPMHAWLSRFKAVDSNNLCDPNYQCGTAYAYGGTCTEGGKTLDMDIGIIGVWQEVTGGCVKNGRFAITKPTDMGCP